MVRYLHTSDTPVKAFADATGRVYREGRPYGLWYGHDLSWIQAMDTVPTWDIRLSRLSRSPVSPLALYRHVFGGPSIPEVKPEDGDIRFLGLPPHYVYEVPIPASAFTTDVSTPAVSSVLRISAATLPAFIASAKEARAAWYANQGPSVFTSSYLDVNPFERVWRAKGPTYTAILQLLGTPAAKKYDVKRESSRIVKAIAEGTIPMTEDLLDLERGFWADHMRTVITKVWGGLDFDSDLFPPNREAILQFPILQGLNADSGVLFALSTVLPHPPPLVAILSGVPVPDAPSGVPVTVFGLTNSGQLRVIPVPSGGRRRRTRRRMFKNPKTLKKRIR